MIEFFDSPCVSVEIEQNDIELIPLTPICHSCGSTCYRQWICIAEFKRFLKLLVCRFQRSYSFKVNKSAIVNMDFAFLELMSYFIMFVGLKDEYVSVKEP